MIKGFQTLSKTFEMNKTFIVIKHLYTTEIIQQQKSRTNHI